MFANYSAFSRSLVFAEMALILAAEEDGMWKKALQHSAAIPIDEIINGGAEFVRMLRTKAFSEDMYAEFVSTYWGRRCWLIRNLLDEPLTKKWRVNFLIARALRISKRAGHGLWNKTVTPNLNALLLSLKKMSVTG